MTRQCIKFHEFGRPEDVLTIKDQSIEALESSELLVRMIMSPINPSDLIPIRGMYAHRIDLPAVPGFEGVGIVEKVGSAISTNLIGKRVLPLRGEGTWQQYVKVQANLAVLLPDDIDDFTAAQLYINPLTAWIICTEVLKLQQNDTLIINACGSAIGRIFAQLSKIIGFHLIAVTRSDYYTKELIELGATTVINTSKDDLQDRIITITDGKGATAGIDSIGSLEGTELAYCLQSEGHFLTLGLLSGIPVNWQAIAQETKVHAGIFHLRHWNRQVTIEAWQFAFQQLITFIMEGKLKLMKPSLQYNFKNIKEAIQEVQKPNKNKGKIFLTF